MLRRRMTSLAGWILPGGGTMKVGARNRIIGTVTKIKNGKVMCLVKVRVPAASRMASVMTLESLKELGVRKGDKVEVVVKAVNVLLLRG
jgi:molybdopterin-binding protein